MYDTLFTPCQIGKLSIKNRFVMPSMKSDMSSEDRKVTPQMIDYYTARARGGFGLLMCEYTLVDPEGAAIPHQLSIYDDSFIHGLKQLTNAVHEAGAKMFVQLHHAGRETSPDVTGMQTVAPSAIPSVLFCNMPRALSVSEIEALVKRYGDAAERAVQAGFDGLEIQMGHGYLLGQFLSPLSNKRTDEYGGNLTGRMKICVDVIRELRRRVGPDFPISARISSTEYLEGGYGMEESKLVAKAMERNGADAIHVSVGTMSSLQYLAAPCNVPNGFNLDNAAAIKAIVHIPVICVGRITEPAMAERAIVDGCADFVALGRASIADPEFPNKVREGRVDEISPCVGCLTRCWGVPSVTGETMISCMLNPFTGHEGTMKIVPAKEPRRIVVIGAGPAGLETAWIAAARGHQVVVLEKGDHAGGQMIAASIAPGKGEFGRAVKYLLTMCQKYGVEIRYATQATAETLAALAPDAVVVATGATASVITLDIQDVPVVTAFDVLGGKAVLGARVVIIGAGMVGLETADFAVAQGRKVTVIERLAEVGNGITGAHLSFIQQNLERGKADIHVNAAFRSARKDRVEYEEDGVAKTLHGCDMIVLATGTASCLPDDAALQGLTAPVHVIGDAVKPNRCFAAIETGARLALEL